MSNLYTPLTAVKGTVGWVEEGLASFKADIISTGIQIVEIYIAAMSIQELESLVNGKHPKYPNTICKFASVYLPFDEYYFTIEETRELVDELLLFQFDQDEEKVAEFWHSLYRVLSRDNGKFNTIEVVGPPNSYKSTFFNWIGAALLNPGFCNKINRYERFSWMNLINKRVGIMDDFTIDSGSIEQALTVFAGDPTNIAVKNHGDHILQPTPIIVLANVHRFLDPRFNARMVRYKWRTWNRKMTKKLNPFAVYLYFNKFYN